MHQQPTTQLADPDPTAAVFASARALLHEARATTLQNQTDAERATQTVRLETISELLRSDDLREVDRGLLAAQAFTREQWKLLEVEFDLFKFALYAAVAERIAGARMQADAGDWGPSPENISEEMSRMMAEIAEQDKADDPPPSPEVETTPDPTDVSTP